MAAVVVAQLVRDGLQDELAEVLEELRGRHDLAPFGQPQLAPEKQDVDDGEQGAGPVDVLGDDAGLGAVGGRRAPPDPLDVVDVGAAAGVAVHCAHAAARFFVRACKKTPICKFATKFVKTRQMVVFFVS